MAEIDKREKTHSEIAAEEVFERHNEVHCIQCRDRFIVEELTDKNSWRCPHCEKQNPNLYFYFLMIGIILAAGIIANLILLVLYMNAVRQDTNIFFVMWSAAHMLLIGYILIALFGDKHSYGLKPLRYLIPIVFVSAVLSAVFYQFEKSLINFIVGAIIYGGIGAFIGYSFYLSYRMVEPHKAEESIIRPVYSIISIAINVILLLIFTTIAIKTTKRTPGKNKIDLGREGGYVQASADMKDVMENIEQIKDEIEIEEPKINPDIADLDRPELKPVINYDAVSASTFIIKKEEEKAVQKMHKREIRNVKLRQRMDRERALIEGGGSDKTEWAVLLALRWLKKHQNQDGSWGEGNPYKVALTGLALLAYLGHGEDHLSEEFGATVRAAIDWLVTQQDDKGYFADPNRAYQHGIATYAITEAYGMTDLEDLLPVADKAIRCIIAGQTAKGGWRYQYIPTADQDLSVSGWQIQALKAAHTAGIGYSDGSLQKAMAGAIKYVQGNFNSAAQVFGYDGGGGTWQENYAMTPTGTLCLQFLSMYGSSEVKGALEQMRKNYKFDWKDTEGGRLSMPLYAWYYATQAFYQATDTPSSNPYWRYWNPQMQNTLLNRQKKDGSWEVPTKSLEKNHLGSPGNADVYATTLCCLMLEVYYRYLPTYRLVQ